jgi:tripartite-type tricarboxylate transporter receptor subunit TctC
VRFTHIPFKGASETQTALLGGHILVATGDFNYPLLEAGQIRLLFLIAENRSSDYTDIPFLKELGYDIPAPTFISIAGPKGMPEPIINKLEDAFTKAMKRPAFIRGMKDLRLPIVYRSSQEMNEFVVNRYEVFEKVLKYMGLYR